MEINETQEKIIRLFIIVVIITSWSFGYVHGFFCGHDQTKEFYLNSYDWVQHLRLKNNVSYGQLDNYFVHQVLLNQTRNSFKGIGFTPTHNDYLLLKNET